MVFRSGFHDHNDVKYKVVIDIERFERLYRWAGLPLLPVFHASSEIASMTIRGQFFLSVFLSSIVVIGVNSARADEFFFENGTVTAGGQQLTMTKLPIKLSNGTVIYRDVVMRFKYVNNTLAFETGFPKLTVSTFPTPGPFVAGTYKAQGLTATLTLAGPYDGPNGRKRWILTALNTSYSAEFYTGPVTGHPLETRITNAKIKSAYTFGYALTGMPVNVGTNNLLALDTPGGGVLYLYNYSSGGSDYSLPKNIVTLIKQ